jgi:hypothetical protein
MSFGREAALFLLVVGALFGAWLGMGYLAIKHGVIQLGMCSSPGGVAYMLASPFALIGALLCGVRMCRHQSRRKGGIEQ